MGRRPHAADVAARQPRQLINAAITSQLLSHCVRPATPPHSMVHAKQACFTTDCRLVLDQQSQTRTAVHLANLRILLAQQTVRRQHWERQRLFMEGQRQATRLSSQKTCRAADASMAKTVQV
jgi:hypothetical protein